MVDFRSMNHIDLIEKIRKFPDTPGCYVMRSVKSEILYIGKATSLRHRVLSYFQRPQEGRIEIMLSQVAKIEIQRTDSVIEALLLENNLIKKYGPKYNVKLKDGKTYLGILVTDEDWPRVMPARSTQKLPKGEFFGPFPSSKEVGAALQILRKLFPFRVACIPESGKFCFEYHLGMCPGVCGGKIAKNDYQENIRQLRLFLHGQKKRVVSTLEKEMKKKSLDLDFESAAKIRDQVFALRHIQDVALIRDESLDDLKPVPARIEAYDISNIGGEFSVGSMVVFTEGVIDKNEYRKFKIKTVQGADDIASLQEIILRRLKHQEWPYPNLILVDGGRGQVNGAKEIIKNFNLDIPIIGIAKGAQRKRNDIIADSSTSSGQVIDIDKKILVRLRDEAHRFAIEYYRKLHRKALK